MTVQKCVFLVSICSLTPDIRTCTKLGHLKVEQRRTWQIEVKSINRAVWACLLTINKRKRERNKKSDLKLKLRHRECLPFLKKTFLHLSISLSYIYYSSSTHCQMFQVSLFILNTDDTRSVNNTDVPSALKSFIWCFCTQKKHSSDVSGWTYRSSRCSKRKDVQVRKHICHDWTHCNETVVTQFYSASQFPSHRKTNLKRN